MADTKVDPESAAKGGSEEETGTELTEVVTTTTGNDNDNDNDDGNMATNEESKQGPSESGTTSTTPQAAKSELQSDQSDPEHHPVVALGADAEPDPEAEADSHPIINTPKGFNLSKRRRAHLEWDNISFKVRERGQEKVILSDVSGSSTPGQMLALMGPSGAGKSSLLNILGCRTTSTRSGSVTVEGTVKCNGEVVRMRM